MFELSYQQDGSRRKSLSINSERFTIGSARQNDLVLKSRKISRRHAVFMFDSSGVAVEDLGSMSGTWVNRERVITFGPLGMEDEITIGNTRFWLRNQPQATENRSEPPKNDMAAERSHTVSNGVPDQALLNPAEQPQAAGPVGHTEKSELPRSAQLDTTLAAEKSAASEQTQYWARTLHAQLIAEMDLRRKDVSLMSDSELRRETEQLLVPIIERLRADIPPAIDVQLLHKNVLDEAVGLGPLEHFLDQDDVTEIMVNNHQEVFVERNGKLLNSGMSFSSDQAVLSVIERIITPIGRRIDESSPMVDARLKDGSRVNAIIPPLALKGPSLTIRKFARKKLHAQDLVNYGSANESMMEFLRVCVEQRKNMLVSGGTGSGKTTLLNVLSNFIPDTERIITVEDAAELKLYQPNLVSLEARPANTEGKGAVTIRELVINTLRMRPDRIVVGECRGGEALDMLQAMNTGHDGSLTTAHANSPRDALARLETMVLMSKMDLPSDAIREQIASAVNVIVQQTRFPCGSRKIVKVSEVVGIEQHTIQLQDIFAFRQTGRDTEGRVQGVYEATGFIPGFYEELAEIGLPVDLSIFRRVGD